MKRIRHKGTRKIYTIVSQNDDEIVIVDRYKRRMSISLAELLGDFISAPPLRKRSARKSRKRRKK